MALAGEQNNYEEVNKEFNKLMQLYESRRSILDQRRAQDVPEVKEENIEEWISS